MLQCDGGLRMNTRHQTDLRWWLGLGVSALVVGATLLAIQLRPQPATDLAAAVITPDAIVVYKHPTCGCCEKWITHLQQAGFKVEARDEAQMSLVKARLGVPEEMASCHTAEVDGYVIEGHVPAEDIRKLLATRPKAKGLAVPGMPIGSPAMEIGEQRDAYDVFLMTDEGVPSVFAHHGSSTAP